MAADKRITAGCRQAIAADGLGVCTAWNAAPATQAPPNPVLAHLARALDAHLRSGVPGGPPPDHGLLDSIVASVMLSCAAAAPASRPAALSPRTLRKVQDFIDANLANQFSVKDIANAACLSPDHLGHAFRQSTGRSLWQHVLQCRTSLACSLIAGQPEATLADIALCSGFESYSQFVTAFRRVCGQTPGDYRRLVDGRPH
jgi:AraC family transcriptional regulator